MSSERRKIVRRSVRYPARIDLADGAALLACTLLDASDEGVQVVTSQPIEWPEQVELVLGYGDSGRRRCRVAWRNGLRAGLEFLAKNAPLHLPAQAAPSTLQTESAAELAQPKPDRTEPAQAPPATFDIDTLPPR